MLSTHVYVHDLENPLKIKTYEFILPVEWYLKALSVPAVAYIKAVLIKVIGIGKATSAHSLSS